MDRIFGMDVTGWADRQLTKFCVTSPLPWFRSPQSGGMQWRPIDPRNQGLQPDSTMQPNKTSEGSNTPVPHGVPSTEFAPPEVLLHDLSSQAMASTAGAPVPGNPYKTGHPSLPSPHINEPNGASS